MKKLSAILLILLMMVSLSSCVGDWSLNYSDTVTTDGWDIALDRDGKMAFAAAYVWDGSEEGRRIRIPDIVEGCTVFKLGGYFGRGLPMPFSVVMPAGPRESVIPAGEEGAPKSEELLFTLVIGPYLEEIANLRDSSDYFALEADGTQVIYHPVFAFEVDENNPVFYAKDGKLYLKRGDELVSDFEYPSEK